MWNRFKKWLRAKIKDAYLLEVYFVQEQFLDKNGLKSVTRAKRSWTVAKVKKHSETYILAILPDGNILEVKSPEPFGYTITKLY
jgi:hypothetical protein